MTAAALKTIPAHKAPWLLPVRLRRAQLQKVARYMRDDPGFPWAAWAELVVNESLFLKPGVYAVDDERQTWAAANAGTALAYGKNKPFETVAEVPPWVLTQCEAGAARAIARADGRRLRLTGADLGNRLGMTWAIRDELKVWMIWPAGATEQDLAERRKQRARERRAYKRTNEMDRRRKDGAIARTDYLDQAALRREACALAGISDRTFKRRSPEARAALLEAARSSRPHVPSPWTPQYSNCPVHGLGPTETPAMPRNVIQLPLREAAAFSRATGVRIGSPGWRKAFDAFTAANDDKAGALIAPADPIEDEQHEDEPARLDWWRQPVPGWSEGRLEIRSILTGEATVIRLSDGKVLSRNYIEPEDCDA